MRLFDTFRSALGALRSNRVRTLLTLLGMIIGVFAIVVSVTAVRVIDVYFQESMDVLGASTFTVSRMPPVQMVTPDRSLRNRPFITYDQVQRLERLMETPVAISARTSLNRVSVRYGERETDENIFLQGTDQDFLTTWRYELEMGRFITAEDVQFARPVAVLASEVAAYLFPNESPLGKQVRADGGRFEVIGVLAERGSFLGVSQDNFMLTPITRGFAIYGRPDRDIGLVSVRPYDASLMAVAMDEAVGRMRTIRRVPPEEGNNFEVGTDEEIRGTFDAFTGTLTIGGLVIGLIALLASGVGIMNIMLVSVTERTREIGVRKSVGARRRDIMRQFVTESFVLCQIGGLAGILFGVMAGNLVAVYFGIRTVFPWDWAIVAVVMVTFIAIGFGGYPAYKAARLDPIESLRYE